MRTGDEFRLAPGGSGVEASRHLRLTVHDLTDAEHHRQLVYEHSAVRDAIARSDPDGARAAMRAATAEPSPATSA